MVTFTHDRMKLVASFAAIYVIWGSTYLAIRWGVETIPPLILMGTRSVIAGSILWMLSRGGSSRVRKEHLPGLVIIGTAFFLIGHGLLAWSEMHIPSGLAAILVASEPLWIMAMESTVLRDTRMTRSGVAGMVTGFLALIVLIVSTESVSTAGVSMLPTLAVLGGTISWSAGAVYARKARLPKSPIQTAGLELLIGGTLLLIASWVSGETSAIDMGAVSVRSLLSLCYLIVFGSVITFTAYIWLLGHTSASRISTHTYINPVIAIAVGAIIGGEVITAPILGASVLILLSVYLALRHPTPPAHSAERLPGNAEFAGPAPIFPPKPEN